MKRHILEEAMSNFINPKIQAMNVIQTIGDEVSRTGKPIFDLNIRSQDVGVPSQELLDSLVEELEFLGLLKIENSKKVLRGIFFTNTNLTLKGWQQYEDDKKGKIDGNYGFLAMQFGEEPLDDFVESVLKPTVEKELSYKINDMRDLSRAGIIDNIMRDQIRRARFVVADLTHDNYGAYWEAGYAEGLNKPVIYICEKKKFDDHKTHFDTNHCTTVTWSRDDDDGFRKEFIATLRRSLESA